MFLGHERLKPAKDLRRKEVLLRGGCELLVKPLVSRLLGRCVLLMKLPGGG